MNALLIAGLVISLMLLLTIVSLINDNRREKKTENSRSKYWQECPVCSGTGVKASRQRSVLDEYDPVPDRARPCSVCKGSGLIAVKK